MKRILLLCAPAVFAVLMSAHRVDAAVETLQLGGNFQNGPGGQNQGLLYITLNGVYSDAALGGGSDTTSYLNGVQLPFDYCVQIEVDVYVPGTYSNTLVTSDGTIDGGTKTVRNAGQIAWLLHNIAPSVGTSPDAQDALQAAIWLQMYGPTQFSVVTGSLGNNTDSTVYSDYVADLKALGQTTMSEWGERDYGYTAPLSDVEWMTPETSAGGTQYQAQITALAPESSSWVVWSLLGTIGITVGWRRRNQRA